MIVIYIKTKEKSKQKIHLIKNGFFMKSEVLYKNQFSIKWLFETVKFLE